MSYKIGYMTYSILRYSNRNSYPETDLTCRLYSRDVHYFNMAKELAETSTFSKRFRIGCIAVLGNTVVSSGINSDKSEPLQKEFDYLRFSDTYEYEYLHKSHAETACLKWLIKNDIKPNRIRLYVYRSLRNGQSALARPCISCRALIKEYGIRRIYYSGDNEFFKEDIKNDEIFRMVKQ